MVQGDDCLYVCVREPDLSTEPDMRPLLSLLHPERCTAADTEDLGYVAHVLQGLHNQAARCC